MILRKKAKASGLPKKSLKAKKTLRKSCTQAPSVCIPDDSELRKNCTGIVEELRQSYRSCEKGYREGLRGIIAKACAVARFLQCDQNSWEEFCQAPRWTKRGRKPHPKRPKEALRYVLLCVSGVGVEAEKRASKWFRAVKPLVEQSVEPKDIPNEIDEGGGIEELARENARRRKEGKLAKGTAPAKQPPAAAKKTMGDSIRHERAAKSPTFVDLRAKLVEEGEEFFSLPEGAHAKLSIVMQGSKGSKFDISILDVKRIKPPVV